MDVGGGAARTPAGAGSRRPSSAVLSRVFTGLSLSRRTGETADEIKGPLGLNLLSAPAEPIVELVFVHGLGGGSRKTWSKGPDPAFFWPKEWLSRDPEFRNVRVHSFGYDSDWVERRESVLNIHDFGKALLAAMQGSPFIRRSSNLPIVLVAHSMGGLVIKKAYLLAQNDPAFRELGKRFHTMYFLATPHHGASSAQLLSAILHASNSGNRPFVSDLHQDSPAIQQINDEFRHVAANLRLYSFFETRPTTFGGIKEKMIVKKTSAVMGYPNERTAHLDADHRGVCKFSSPSDPSFITVKNALVETLDKIKENWDTSNRELLRNQKRRLRSFLYISDQLEDNHVDFDEPRAEGSCEWLVQTPGFRRWRDSALTKAFWLNGNPATGKSVLANYVVEHLTDLSSDCSYYFFKEGDKVKSALSKCLLSLAYQMACSNVTIREAFLEMQEDDVQVDEDSYQSIWRKLFVGGIFQLKLYKPHYWILDALDECKNCIDLVPLISKIDPAFPLRVFVTSRPSLELQSQLQLMNPAAEMQQILPEHTIDDIRRYVENHTDFPSMQDRKTRRQLVATILDKSEGCFLWVRLVLKELRKVHSVTATQKILEDVPQGMDKLYVRTLASVSEASYGKPLAKAILMWAVCSVRPLTTTELKHALQIDINDTVHNPENQIASLCGHLAYVDPQFRVKIIHQTARNFLLNPDSESEFAFHEKDGHQRLALACLKCLLHDSMKAPRSRRPGATAHQANERSPLLDYAAKSFFEHINRSSSTDQELLSLLYTFLSSSHGNVLSWIEYIARCGDLNHLTRTGMVLRTYLKRRAKRFPPLGKEVKTVDSWSTDLIRIVAKFGRNLLRFPPSIHYIIPPFCPQEAAPYQQFGRSARGISVMGLSSKTWDDCLACIVYRMGSATAISCGGNYFAIGTSNKVVRLYHTATCQEFGRLEHGEPVKNLEFNISSQLLASSGRKSVRIWDVASKGLMWHIDTNRLCIAMTFTSDNKTFILACHDNHLHSYGLDSGDCTTSEPWYMDVDHSKEIFRMPDTAAFSLEHKLLAFVYRGSHINLWNWEDGYFVGVCEKPSVKKETLPFHASSLVFNPATNRDSLAAAYEDGELLVFDPLEGYIKATYKADTDAQTLASSPDGRTLISGDSVGTIRVFDFEVFDFQKLKLLHIIHGRGDNIRSLAFFSDNLRFVDTRGSQSNVWEPAVLVRQEEVGEEASDVVSLELQETPLPEPIEIDVITTMALEPRGAYIFCGTEGGLVNTFETRTGRHSQTLYKHSTGISITKLAFEGGRGVIASADSSSRVLVYQLASSPTGWKTMSLLLEYRMEEPIENLLFSPDGMRILVATTTNDTLCALDGGVVTSLSWDTRNAGIWANHPQHATQLLLVVNNYLRIYEWDGLKELTTGSGIKLDHDVSPEFEVRTSYLGWNGRILVTEYSEFGGSRSNTRLLLWDATSLDASVTTVSPYSALQPFGDRLAHLIGILGTMIGMTKDSITFLDHEGWICSVDMEETLPKHYKRHFFLPYDWLSTNDSLLFGFTEKHDIIFGRDDRLAVIKRGLDQSEILPFKQSDDNQFPVAMTPPIGGPEGWKWG
ncbi:hypothetical protein GP486_000416 [Trichoglossum hirsutum]|uniref:GPI inositol-deacylase n=1 Tax=Trichoglossum hirsutum TaxID=265104 RepID=A0A9P8LJ27_9PEZI|nr:hypothetical protein GP486_000416 [Trichoglossum hirsutum]